MKKKLYNQIKEKVDEIASKGFALANECNRTYVYDYKSQEVYVLEHSYGENLNLANWIYPIFTDEGDWENFHECFDCRNRFCGANPIDKELAKRCEFESIYYNILFYIPDVVQKIMEDMGYES